MRTDRFHLQRFVDAQSACFEQVRDELAAGQKRSHWMWFIFPQVRGLGSSSMAQRFAISGLEEAAAYLNHPILGARLRMCTALVNAVTGRPVDEIFPYPDDLKFHSSMTLFSAAMAGGAVEDVFAHALALYFEGVQDPATVALLHIL